MLNSSCKLRLKYLSLLLMHPVEWLTSRALIRDQTVRSFGQLALYFKRVLLFASKNDFYTNILITEKPQTLFLKHIHLIYFRISEEFHFLSKIIQL